MSMHILSMFVSRQTGWFIPNCHSNDLTESDPKYKESDIAKPDSGGKESGPSSKPKPHSEIYDPAVAIAACVVAETVARQVWKEFKLHCADQQWHVLSFHTMLLAKRWP